MTERDSFIEEVSEEVRRDRLYALLRRYGWIGGLVILAIVGGAATNEFLKARAAAEAEARGAALAAAEATGDPGTRAAAYEALMEGDGAAAIARFGAAAARAEAGEIEAALAHLDAISTGGETTAIYRDLAQIKAVQLRAATLTPEALLSEILPLAQDGRPFRLLALEQAALARIASGDMAGAEADLDSILTDPSATPALRQRAAQVMVAIGGEIRPQATLTTGGGETGN